MSGYFLDLFLQKLAVTANKTTFHTNCEKLQNFFPTVLKTGPWNACNIQGLVPKIVGIPCGPAKNAVKCTENAELAAGLG